MQARAGGLQPWIMALTTRFCLSGLRARDRCSERVWNKNVAMSSGETLHFGGPENPEVLSEYAKNKFSRLCHIHSQNLG